MAAYIDVNVEDFLPKGQTLVNVWPIGAAQIPDTPQWRQLRETVEETVNAALASITAPAPASVLALV